MDTLREPKGTADLFEWPGRRVTPLRTYGGRSCEAVCDYCSARVEKDEIEFEVEGELDGEPVTLHLHQRCHDICLGLSAVVDLRDCPAPSR